VDDTAPAPNPTPDSRLRTLQSGMGQRCLPHAVRALALALAVFGCAAAEPPTHARSTPGSVVPSSGTTAASAPQGGLRPARASEAARGRTAGSLSGPPARDCDALRRRYAQSQACFAPYRLANGAVRPEAFERCREMPDPALTCGPAIVSP
jgi:hypothetical protein